MVSGHVWVPRGGAPRGIVLALPSARERYTPIQVQFEGSIQYLVESGYAYVAFDMRARPARHGDEDSAFDEDDVKDAVAVVRHTARTFGLPPARTALLAESSGTRLAVRLLEQAPHSANNVVLRGFTASAGRGVSLASQRLRVAALHGENDAFPPGQAKEALNATFSPEAFRGGRGLWRILKDEGHTPRLLRSRAQITASIVALLETGVG